MDKVGKTVIFSMIMVISVTVHGYGLSILWGWFISPVFSIGPISVPYAIGLATVFAFIASKPEKEQEAKDPMEAALYALIYTLAKFVFSMISGFIVLQFV